MNVSAADCSYICSAGSQASLGFGSAGESIIHYNSISSTCNVEGWGSFTICFDFMFSYSNLVDYFFKSTAMLCSVCCSHLPKAAQGFWKMTFCRRFREDKDKVWRELGSCVPQRLGKQSYMSKLRNSGPTLKFRNRTNILACVLWNLQRTRFGPNSPAGDMREM